MLVHAFAKVNLTLSVIGERDDGYHELRSLVAPISLCDKINLDLKTGKTITSNLPYANDLCVKAAKELRRNVSRDVGGVVITVEKFIPEGGGLGGGSADAAAVLLALNELWEAGFSPEELAAIGACVGSDVPALVMAQHYREVVLMEGRGEKVTRLKEQPGVPSRGIILVNPRVNAVTKKVFSKFRPDGSERINQLEPAAVSLYPKIQGALDFLSANGVKGVRMTGSGSTVFGFSDNFLYKEHAEYDIIPSIILADCPVV